MLTFLCGVAVGVAVTFAVIAKFWNADDLQRECAVMPVEKIPEEGTGRGRPRLRIYGKEEMRPPSLVTRDPTAWIEAGNALPSHKAPN